MKLIKRRTVLKGILYGGITTLALPMLEMFLNNHGNALADGTALPPRFVLLFWGNGTRIKSWIPQRTGPNYALSPVLMPYAPVKDYLSVITGTQCKINGFVHHWGVAGMLTAAPHITSNVGTSTTLAAPTFDQVIAKHIGQSTRFKSLEVGVLTPTKTDEGSTLQYLSHNGPNDVNPPETSPKALFSRLFGKTTLQSKDGSVLDTVLKDLNRLKKRVGHADTLRLDAYTTQVRAIESSLQSGGSGLCSAISPGDDATSIATVEAITRRSQDMWNLITTALSCDLTRVVSVQYCGASDCIQVPAEVFSGTPLFEGGSKQLINDLTHGTTHNESTPDQPVVTKWSTFYQSQFSNFLQTMKATNDGDGHLLDHSAVMITSEVSQGRNHSDLHMPFLLAGRANGRLRYPGIHYAGNSDQDGAIDAPTPSNTFSEAGDITSKGDKFANTTDAHMTVLRALNVPLETWGDQAGASSRSIGALLT